MTGQTHFKGRSDRAWARGLGGAVCGLLVSVNSPGATGGQGEATGDWPMWRYDAGRRAVTPVELPETLHLQWVRQLPAPRPAWAPQGDNADKLDFDLAYRPVAAGGILFVPCMVRDRLLALDTASGRERWRFYADGPIRFAPVVWRDRVYVVSDDNGLYCLEAATGRLLWRFAGSPAPRKVLGNERLISLWPARGGPVLKDDALYFAAGIWPFMGIFLHAVDPETGEAIWSNSASGAVYNLHQHGGAMAYGGVAPQGYLAATADRLLVAGGRTPPAVYDRHTGEFLYFRQATGQVGKGAGGYAVFAHDGWFSNHGELYALEDGAQHGPMPAAILTDNAFIGIDRVGLVAHGAFPEKTEIEVKDRLGRRAIRELYAFQRLWRHSWEDAAVELDQLHLMAGTRLYGSGPQGRIAALRLPDADRPPQVVWSGGVNGDVAGMLAADDRLFVVTREGAIHCFGAQPVAAPEWHSEVPGILSPADTATGFEAEWLVRQAGIGEGYALFLGVGDGDLLEQVALRSGLHVVGIDPDRGKIERLRRRWDEAGLYGTRVALLPGSLADHPYPPYVSSLIVVQDFAAAHLPADRAGLEQVWSLLRPYGGVACLGPAAVAALAEPVHRLVPDQLAVRSVGDHRLLVREGPLPGSDIWTHQHRDPANTVLSQDDRVRLPLGLLWFGGPANWNILPRHAAGPRPQVAGGRQVFLGIESLSARDVYTGRALWTRQFPGLGHPFTNLELEAQYAAGEGVYMSNIPGATYIGSPSVTLPDNVYLRHRGAIHRLDAATGDTLAVFALPGPDRAGEVPDTAPDWGHLSVWDNLIVTTTDPHLFEDQELGWTESWSGTSSRNLVVLERMTGAKLWSRPADIGFRHNAIVTAAGTLFVIDGLSEKAIEFLARRGRTPDRPSRILALDARTGAVRWQAESDVFGTFLCYSEAHDILIEGGSRDGRRPLPDEPGARMTARRGQDGRSLWERSDPFDLPAVIRDDTLIPGRPGVARSLLTGEDLERRHPLTDEAVPWDYWRTYGCNTLNASRHLLFFRSGAAAFVDLEGDGGTGNFGGFRSGCTANMIPAEGILNVLDYTRTCSCSYQNQTSLALVHMPEVELWTSNRLPAGVEPVQRLGINLGAPGNRRAPDGTLWIDLPRVGGPAPAIDVTLVSQAAEWLGDRQPGLGRGHGGKPETQDWFRQHSLFVADPGDRAWVAASGARGIRALTVNPNVAGPTPYTVRLWFLEPDRVEPGERVFDIHLQGRPVATGVDVVSRAGGVNRGVHLTFEGIVVEDVLHLELKAVPSGRFPPVLSGLELVRAD